MIAIEYTDMMSRMITTVIATGPMFRTISLSVNSLLAGAAGAAGLGVCQRKRRKPIAFVPRMLVKIVTVTPPKGFDYIDSVPARRPSAGSSRFFWSEPARRNIYCATKL
jgi:hypothetical protein